MSKEPTYEELEYKVQVLEKESAWREQAAEELKQSEEVYRILVKTIPHGIQEVDASGVISFGNEAYHRLMGYEEGELIGRAIWDFIEFEPASGKEELQRYLKLLVKDQPLPTPYTQKNRRKDEKVIDVQVDWNYKTDEQGFATGFISVLTDITERKLSEKALRESEERFRDTATMLPSVIVEYGLDGILTYVNPHGYELAGYVPEDFEEGFHVLQLVAPEEHAKHYERIQRMMQGEKIPPTEYRLLRKDGSILWGLVTSSLIHKDGEVVGVRTYTIDISERKAAEEALKERTRELELQKKSLEELNTAMKILLIKREEDKTEVEENVMTNVKELILPYFDKINETKLDDYQKAFLNILESNLDEIISPFTRKLSLKYLSLTPREITIVNMIKIGYPSKKIAKLMNISPRTVDTHRKNIRSKIGLNKKKGNLRSHLLAFEQ
jgi:PAS domain S-box-containing protein